LNIEASRARKRSPSENKEVKESNAVLVDEMEDTIRLLVEK
jgi:hypothetical protein